MKPITLLFTSVVLVFSWGYASAAAQADRPLRPQLSGLVEEALQNNPDLAAARERWEMSEHRILPAQSLDDPTLGVAFSNYPIDSLRADETPMTGNEFRIAQNFPFPGKLAAKGDVARQQALWFKAVYEDARLQLAQKVEDVYYRLSYQQQAIAVTEENLAILENFISLTKTRYEVGSGLQQDLLKAQLQQTRLMDRLFTLRQQRRSLLAGFNRLLDRPAGQPLEVNESLELRPVAADTERLKEFARQNRPMFASYQALIDRYASQRDLAELDYYPNFNVWTSYRFRDDDLPDTGTDFISAGVTMNLPIWREKRSAAVAEAEAGLRMARRQRDDFGSQVNATIQDVSAQLEKNRELAQLYATGLLPQAQQTFDASLSAYQVGKVDFLSLLDSLMRLYNYQLDYQQVLADYQRNIAQLEAAAGYRFSAAPLPSNEAAGEDMKQ